MSSAAFRFVLALGVVNLFGDMTYEGAREARDQRVSRADARAERARAKALWNVYRRQLTPEFAEILKSFRELRLKE